MRKLNKQVLLELGFEECRVSAEESGDKPYVYYNLDLDDHDSLISDSVDEPITDDELFVVNLFNSELGYCETDEEVKILYKALKGEELK